MHWKEAFKLSAINHRGPYLRFICWALNVEVGKIAEIGVNKGETSRLLRHLFPEAKLYLIDPWSVSSDYLHSGSPISRKTKHYEKAYQMVQDEFKNDPATTLLRMSSREAAASAPNDFDLVFIDGNHEYTQVKEDILCWLPKVKTGGILAGHDYDPSIPIFDGVKRAVDEVFGNQLMLGKDRVWLHQKKIKTTPDSNSLF